MMPLFIPVPHKKKNHNETGGPGLGAVMAWVRETGRCAALG
jgi:hypothetical protein